MKTVLKIAFFSLLLVMMYHTGLKAVFSTETIETGKVCIPAMTHQLDAKQFDAAEQETNVSDSFGKMDMEIYRPVGSQDVNSNLLRIRKGNDSSVSFKNMMQQLAYRDELLVQGQTKIFPSYLNHYVLPACHYYVFALRRILI